MTQPTILRDGKGREVVKFTTPSGVTAYVATCIPDKALQSLVRKLTRKIREGERRRAQRSLAKR